MYSYRPSDWIRKAMPMNPRAPPSDPAPGWPARSTSIVPSRNDASLTTAYEEALAAPGVAITCTAVRPLKVVCAIDTFVPASRSTVCAARGAMSSVAADSADAASAFTFVLPLSVLDVHPDLPGWPGRILTPFASSSQSRRAPAYILQRLRARPQSSADMDVQVSFVDDTRSEERR